MLDDILRIDWDEVRFKRAAGTLVVLLLVLAFVASASDVTMTIVLSTMFVTVAGGGGPLRERLTRMVPFAIVGALLGGLAFWSFEHVAAIAIVLGIATYAGTLPAALDQRAALAGLLLTLWTVFAMILGSAQTPAWQVALAFLGGSGVGIGIVAIRLHFGVADDVEEDSEPESASGGAGHDRHPIEQLREAMTGPVGRFAIVRSAAIMVGVVLGFWWFPSHPLWVALTVLVSLQPSASQSVSIAVQRTLGTSIGVALAVAVAQILPRGDLAVMIAFALSGFLMISFQGANYTLFATFLTAMIVFGERLVEPDSFDAGVERLLATVVGGAISMALAVGMGWRDRMTQARAPT
jgi:hypothetical protein